MPFVQRVITPKFVARSSHPSRTASPHAIQDYELETITNVTLSNALRQLASLVLVSNEIFTELNKELQNVSERSRLIKQRIDNLGKKVEEYDPKSVTVPESDLVTFVQIKNHYKTKYNIETSLFTANTRSETLQNLYDAAAKTPVPVMAEMDRIAGQRDRKSSDAFLCTPVLGQTRRKLQAKVDMEIETRLPSALEDLRKWTSYEAIGDVTVMPSGVARVGVNSTFMSTSVTSPSLLASSSTSADVTDDIIVVSNSSRLSNNEDDMPLDHRLPSPEEQSHLIALKYPAETIRVDTSGRRFDRMCIGRKSLLHFVSSTPTEGENTGDGEGDTIRRRSRSRKPRGKRRNTIAGTDQKEISEVVNNGNVDAMDDRPSEFVDLTIVTRSKSSDLLKKDSPSSVDSVKATNRSSHFNSLKQWGRNRLRLMRDSRDKVQDIDDFNISETTKNQRKKSSEKDRKLSHERKPSYSSSEKSLSLATNMPSNVPASINPVKLRESSSIRRQRRTALGNRDEPHSSSGNWSASSESGRTSIGSEITTTTHPKSSASSTSLNHNNGPPSSIISRRRFLNTSASSSVTSEGTATPDLQFNDYHDEGGETSSVYSCDTEGYYTSFHVDSGLKTLKEEEPATPLHSTTALSSTTSFESSGNQTVISPENEYELFGRGSTSTTTSSAGTICTVLADNDRNSSVIGPAVPERKSSLTKLNRSNSNASSGTLERSYSSSTVGSTLERTGTIKRNGILLQKEVAALIHNDEMNKNERIESPDSGNNTSSSPVESNANSSPTQGVRSYSEFEYSESSDLECVDRIERIRIKTTINTSRIPSMCIITPTNSDDERESSFSKEKPKKPESLKIKDMFGKLKGVLKKSPNKEEPIYDATGDYVTISDVRNNNNGNDILRKNLATVLSGNLNEETEYVSLNELPCNIRCESNLLSNSINEKEKGENLKDEEMKKMDKKGARVKLDAQGMVIYSSDSLKRRKGAHTTFIPGKFVKDNNNTASSVDVNVHSVSSDVQNIASPLLSGGVANRKALNIRPVVSQIKTSTITSPGVIKEQAMSGVLKGAYVNVQTTTTSSSSSTAIMQDYQHLSHDEVDDANTARMSQLSTFTSSTLPKRPIMSSRMDTQMPVEQIEVTPFQRTNNVYWTLQTRKPNNNKISTNEIVSYENYHMAVKQQEPKNLEDLYSTPNKIKKELKTTPVGFATFFSPITKIQEESPLSPPPLDQSSLRISPIDPRNTIGIFKTSTPSKGSDDAPISPKPSLTEELRLRLRSHENGIRSQGNSPANSGRSTPKGIFEPQTPRGRHSWASNSTDVPQTCSDRLGTPKTSLMDFKKLLLAHSSKSTVTPGSKLSAVEMLKKSKSGLTPKQNTANSPTSNPNMSILDLSGSPKAFATRRMLRQGNFTSSPSKTLPNPKHLSGKNWRYNNMRTEVMSMSIPEANSEEDNSSPNTSNAVSRSQSLSRSSSPAVEANDEKVVEEKIANVRDNIFLKADENNFMKGEKVAVATTRAQLQASRAQFFYSNNNNNNNNNNNINTNNKMAQFRNGFSTNTTNSYQPISATSAQSFSPKQNGGPVVNANAPSLETAL